MKRDVNNFKKVFVYLSMIFILLLIVVYSSRLVYFYMKENLEDNKNLSDNYFNNKLEKTINVTDASGGLYINENEYIYKYNSTENYIWYSGQLWRILKINEDGTIDIMMDESLTILSNNYEDYLNDFYDKLDHEYLVKIDYCNDLFDNIENIKCENKVESYITLLDIYSYNKAGAISSYLNDNSSFWLVNKDSNDNNWYINKDGSLSISYDTDSFGIKPIVRLKSEINLISGDGTKDNPYIIKEKMNQINIGEYVMFNDELWRIINVDNKNVTISKKDCISVDNECVLSKFGDTSVYEKSELYNYLNKYYENIIDKDLIINTPFEIGTYDNYDYKNTKSEIIELPIGISKVGDYYIGQKTNSYLLTPNNIESIYSINETSNYYITFLNEEMKIYPVLTVNFNTISGTGTIKDPYKLSR